MNKSYEGFSFLLIIPHTIYYKVEHYNDVEDMMDRAYTWSIASQASGLPMVLLNIQIEASLTWVHSKIKTIVLNKRSISTLSNIENVRLYNFEDYNAIKMSDEIVCMNVIGNGVNDIIRFHLIKKMILDAIGMF